jgi:uncharacterized protein YjiS (DUF1127 family)
MLSKCAPVRHLPSGAGIAGRILGFICVLELALEVRRERQMLLNLDDRALKDIGLSRSQVWAEACRSLWEVPCDRLSL